MKLALSVYFSKKHCFPSKEVPKGQGYTQIQSHLWHLGKSYTMKEVLYQLATTYTVRNKISGLIPGSPMPGKSNDETLTTLTQRGLSSWQSTALDHTLGIQQKRNKFKQFCINEVLDNIRKDYRLNHSIVPFDSVCGVTKGNDGSEKKKQVKNYNYPRCVVCSALVGSIQALKSAFACRTCRVVLCIKPRGQNKKSCFEKWHSVKKLEGLLKNNSTKPNQVRSLPKRKKGPSTLGSFTTAHGRRRSKSVKVTELSV